METSCLKNRNVADAFETLIELTYRDSTFDRENKNIVLGNDKNYDCSSKSSGCCLFHKFN